MRTSFMISVLLAATLIAGAASADSVILWDEFASIDLSNDGLFPDLVDVRATSNAVHAEIGSGADQRDVFTFTVESGDFVTGIFVDAYEPDAGNPSTGFTLYAGTVDPGGDGLAKAEIMVGSLYDENLIEDAGTLGPGNYTVSIRDFSPVASPQRYYLAIIQNYESIARNGFETGDFSGWDETSP